MTSFKGKVKDWLNWNNPLLTGKEAFYGPITGKNSTYWVDALTGTNAEHDDIRTAANEHAQGWQGYLADQLKAEGAASGWDARGYMNTQTLQRQQFDPNKPFLKVKDLRANNPGGYRVPVAAGHQYDFDTAMSIADEKNLNYGNNQSVYDNYNDLNLSTPHYKAMGGESSTPWLPQNDPNNTLTAYTNTGGGTNTVDPTNNASTGGTNFLSNYNSLDELKAALTSGSTANTTTTDNSFDQFTKFLSALSGMSGLFGGGGGGYTGPVGGVSSAPGLSYFSNLANSSNAFRYNQNKLASTGNINV